MTQKEIDFIRSRWSGRMAGSDVEKLVARIKELADEVDRLNVIDKQPHTTEDILLDKIEGKDTSRSQRLDIAKKLPRD